MKRKIVIITILLFLVLGFAAFSIVCSQKEFTGSRAANSDSYMLDIERMNGTESHTLDLSAGDNLQIQFETEKGSMYMEIKAQNGTVMYAGNGKGAEDFTLNISESGVYTVMVEARRAKGTIHIQRKAKNIIYGDTNIKS